MAATTGFLTDTPPPRSIVHPTTAPTTGNIVPIGTLWTVTAGPTKLFCASAQAAGPSTTWTQIK